LENAGCEKRGIGALREGLTGGELEGGTLALEVPQLQGVALLGGGEDEAVGVEHTG
jgi:hypothetical protein